MRCYAHGDGVGAEPFGRVGAPADVEATVLVWPLVENNLSNSGKSTIFGGRIAESSYFSAPLKTPGAYVRSLNGVFPGQRVA